MNAYTPNMPTDQIDTRVLRDIMGQFATGVTIITTLGDNGAPVGMAANSFASVSLDPPLVVWSIDLNAPSLSAFRTHPSFAINIMCEDSKDLVMNFAKPSDKKFAEVSWQAGLDGVPVLDAASTVIQCRTENRIEGGDHEMYLGRVIDCHKTDKAPLIFHKGKFAKLGNPL